MRRVRIYTGMSILAGAAAAAGCASTGATFGSGVGDSFPDDAPYYAGRRVTEGRVAVLPIRYQRGASQSALFDPAESDDSPIASLLAEMNTHLESIVGTVEALDVRLPGTPPDVHFGCELDAGGECSNGPAAPFEWGAPRMRLAVGRPSGEWTDALAGALASHESAHALVITLEVGQYWPRQTNWRGSKAVDLGTDHHADLRWLTSLETPVTVLQLTGAVVGPDGRAERIGAEGMLARRTGIIAAGFGAQSLITEADVEELRTLRRDDLPGRPLVWQVALRTLVAQLTGEAPGR
jgi:hypothetical protein